MTTLSADLPVLDDLEALFLNDTPMMDMRAPVEFAEGAFPHTQNQPLMSDHERELVGKCYKQNGQDAAIELGHQLVGGEVKQQRVAAWAEFVKQYPQGVLYCFRGGLRSRISQQWIYEQTGVQYPRVNGGYKAMRRFLIDQTEERVALLKPLVLSGRTGSGKTRFLRTYRDWIDLEGLANHRGSAFGNRSTPQPTQVGFENALAIELVRKVRAADTPLLFEDESRNVGSVHLPVPLLTVLQTASLIVLQVEDEARVEISYQEYVIDMTAEFVALHGNVEQGLAAFSDYLLGSLFKIRKRLGGVRYQQVLQMMETALAEQRASGDTEAHREWVRFVLLDYYDPMYDYQLSKKQERVVFTGNSDEVRDYIKQQCLLK